MPAGVIHVNWVVADEDGAFTEPHAGRNDLDLQPLGERGCLQPENKRCEEQSCAHNVHQGRSKTRPNARRLST
jgi:hypothetical protein